MLSMLNDYLNYECDIFIYGYGVLAKIVIYTSVSDFFILNVAL